LILLAWVLVSRFLFKPRATSGRGLLPLDFDVPSSLAFDFSGSGPSPALSLENSGPKRMQVTTSVKQRLKVVVRKRK